MNKFSIITATRNSFSIADMLNVFPYMINEGECLEYVIVDNNSDNMFIDSLKVLATVIKEECNVKFQIIKLGKNYLFSHAINVGLNYILNRSKQKPDYIFIIVPNIGFFNEDKNTFKKVILDMEKTNADIAGCRLVFPDMTTVEHLGGIDNTHLGYGTHINVNDTEPIEVEWVTGSLMCFKINTIKSLGSLDEISYTHWVSDQEYCRRAENLGMKTIVSMQTFIHLPGTGTPNEAHAESQVDLPENIRPNLIPFSLEHIKETALINSKKVPLEFIDRNSIVGEYSIE